MESQVKETETEEIRTMRITLTVNQAAKVNEHLADYDNLSDLTIRKSYLEVPEDQGQAVLDHFIANAEQDGRSTANQSVARKLAEAIETHAEGTHAEGTPAEETEVVAEAEAITEEAAEESPVDRAAAILTGGQVHPLAVEQKDETDADGTDFLSALNDALDTTGGAKPEAEDYRPASDYHRAEDEDHALPEDVRVSLASIRNGVYGDAAQKLLEGMDTREGERATRYVGRLRHKLYSSGNTAADRAGEALHIVKVPA